MFCIGARICGAVGRGEDGGIDGDGRMEGRRIEVERMDLRIVQQADAPNPAITSLFQARRHRRGVGDPCRWT